MSNIEALKHYGLVYIATPFTRYEGGLQAAHVDACKFAAKLLKAGLYNIRCPIAEAYPIAWHGGIDALDLSIWQPFCDATLGKCDAMIVGTMKGWERSSGIAHEIELSDDADRPVYFMSPFDLSYSETMPEIGA